MTPSTDPDERVSRMRLFPLGDNAHAPQRIGMTDRRQRQPASDEAPHAIPKNAAVLAPPRQRAMPIPAHSEPKNRQRRLIHGHSVVSKVSTHNRPQPFALCGDGFVHSSLKLGFHLIQLRLQPFADRLPQHREPSMAPLLHADMRVSRPAELHHRPLAEPSVRLSPHSAPIRQTCRSYGLSVARIEVLLFPVASVMRPPDPTPSLQPHYGPSSLLRVGPPQCSASVRSPRGFGRLGFFLNIRATGSCSSAQQPASASRPLYAGRRPLSHQAPRGLVPGGLYAPDFDDTYFLNDASSKGSLSFVSRMLICTGLYPRFSSNAHQHGSLPQQLGSVWDLLQKADPEASLLPHPFPIFQAPGVQPFSDEPHDASVGDPVLDELHQPFVENLIEKAAHVQIKHPAHFSRQQSRVEPIQRLMLAASWSKPVRVSRWEPSREIALHAAPRDQARSIEQRSDGQSRKKYQEPR